jgi:beta-xylosidase
MAAVELNKDMTSIRADSLKIITPDSKFREGTYVFYRDGIYYFLWSEEDTGSPDYKVCYGTSTNPTGPITVPSKNIVISRDDAKAIYGTGHNSIIQIPGRDEWYIVYHRFTRPKGIDLKHPGYFREVCIDKLEFNTDGSIKKVQPTLEGIAPVTITKYGLKQTARN